MTAAFVLFSAGVLWIAYVWIGYPLLLAGLARLRSFRHVPVESHTPSVSVLIAARNEDKDIGWKLAQTLAWDYPADRLEVLVGSDASTDGTDDILRSVTDRRFRFVRNRERAGKAATLNRLAALARGELLFFTDANTNIDARCLKRITRHFADSRVGCVTGMEQNLDGDDASRLTAGSNTYLGYEASVNKLESKFGSVLVCDGSVYCIRRHLFGQLDPDLANDLEHPVRIGGSGFAILYEPLARSSERCTSSSAEEFQRRRRIAAQGGLALWRLRRQLHGLRLWQFLSRKFLRWLTPLPLAAILVSSLVLREQPLFSLVLLLQIAFYALAILGMWIRGTSRIANRARLPFVFILAHLAVFAGILDACRRKTFATWNIADLSRGPNPERG
jgi:cellulose synthase/poly-beta-1,6-N-acetylglucosamine synthase-like glycosyltransferase